MRDVLLCIMTTWMMKFCREGLCELGESSVVKSHTLLKSIACTADELFTLKVCVHSMSASLSGQYAGSGVLLLLE